MKITNCRVNHLENPLGFDFKKPVFSWVVENCKGQFQTDAFITISLEPSMENKLLCIENLPKNASMATPVELKLKPKTKYYWTVSVATDMGEEITSPVNWFETAKQDELWQAKWITCNNDEKRHPVFVKAVALQNKVVAKARVYVCGLGLYEFQIDGVKVGEEYLTPYCNDYSSWVQYQTFDVTNQIKSNSKIGFILGNGWYKGRFGFESAMETGQGYYGSQWKLIAEINIEYADGTSEFIFTDNDWKVERSNITFSNIYDGEHVNSSLPNMPVENAVLANPPQGALTARISPPVVSHERFVAKEIINTKAGEKILDMGQNFTGIFRLKVCEPMGTKIHIQFGEVLQNGNFYRENLRSALAEYYFVCDGTKQVIEPKFTFYGYRFVKIEGVTNLKAEDFTGIALYTQLNKTGHITTGHKSVNQLISNTQWGQKGNFVDVPTDCPQRDERMGWTGDAQVFASTACYLQDCYAFFNKYVVDIAKEQSHNDGKVPVVVPSFGIPNAATAWSDAATIIPWTLYEFYGDKQILENQFKSMCAWVDYVTRLEKVSGTWLNQFHYGDWLALDNISVDVNKVLGATDSDFIASVYYAYSAQIVADAATILGNISAAKYYSQLNKSVRKQIQEKYYTSTGRCCIKTQTALLLTLKHNLSENRSLALEMLEQLLADNGNKLSTGFVGTPILCDVLSANNRHSLAYDLLLSDTYPGWLYSVKMGATTIWERWNSITEDGSISSTGMNSLNHYSYGSILHWMFYYAAGIQCASAGFKQVHFEPVPNSKLGFMNASYLSANGKWHISWEILENEYITITVEVPFNCKATLSLPFVDENIFNDKLNPMFANVKNKICYLNAGVYTVTYAMEKTLNTALSIEMPLRILYANKTAKKLVQEYVPVLANVSTDMQKYSILQLAVQFKIITKQNLKDLQEQLERIIC